MFEVQAPGTPGTISRLFIMDFEQRIKKHSLFHLLAVLTSSSKQASLLKFTTKKVLKYRSLYYKTLRIRNLQEIENFRSKLVSSGLDNKTYEVEQTNTLAYY
jgi:hypothetical protein